MSTQYRLDVLTPDGAKIGELPFTALNYKNKVNAPGLCTFSLNGDDTHIALLEDEAQIEVWYRDPDNAIDWLCDFRGIYDAQESSYSNVNTFNAIVLGSMTRLSWRINAFAANTTNATLFTNVPAETIMKMLVAKNFANTSGRDIGGEDTRISIAADLGRGAVLSRGNAYKNILEELQYLATIAGGDFDLNKVAPNQWQFEFYQGQRGTDRTATQLFSLQRGNITNVKYARNCINFRTVAIVKGTGQNEDRATEIRTSSAYTAYHREIYVDSNESTSAGLQAKGDAALFANRIDETVSFDVLQTKSSLYRKHYFLGDIVVTKPKDTAIVQKINGIEVKLTSAGESVKVEMVSV